MHHFIIQYKIWLILLLCLLFGPLANIFTKIAFTSFSIESSFFVNQTASLGYTILGSLAIFVIERFKNKENQNIYNPSIPHSSIMIMGFLDALASILTAVSSSRVTGESQQLLNQAIIPFTMLISWICLGIKHTSINLLGSFIIFIGAIYVVLSAQVSTDFLDESNVELDWLNHDVKENKKIYPLSIFLFFLSNIPTAFSFVYKEHILKQHLEDINIVHILKWVSIYQLLFGYILGVLQYFPGMGSDNGMTIYEMGIEFYNGYLCFIERGDEQCIRNSTFRLVLIFIFVSFSYNITQLYLILYGSATLNAISNAIILPITILSFHIDYLGKFKEPYHHSTIIGLVIILCGFLIWNYDAHYGYTEIPDLKEETNNFELTQESQLPDSFKIDFNNHVSFQNFNENEFK